MGQNGQAKSPLRRAENESLKCSESMKQGNTATLEENGKDQIEADVPEEEQGEEGEHEQVEEE